MRRKNGYTLTEILVVILLLAIVGGIIIFNVNSILNKNKAKSYERYIANVKSSAETYATLNVEKISDLYENKSFTYITAGELIDQGFLDEKTTNPYTNQRIGRDELIKLSLSTETGDLTVTYPANEENKEVFLSSVVLSTTVGTEVDCMDGIGTYTLALSDETGKLILDKNTLINDYKFTCKLPEGFDKRSGNANNEIGSSTQIGTYEIDYYWVSKSGTKGTGKRFLKVVPNTITITYDVGVLEGNPVQEWTTATCIGKISTVNDAKVCTKEVLVGYNYNTLSRPIRTGYTFIGWFKDKQTDPENPGNGIEITANNKVVEKTNHTLYAHWDRKRFGVTLNSDLNGRPATNPGTTSVSAKYNVILENITIPERVFDIIFNLNDSRVANGTTEGTSSSNVLNARWNFDGYYTESGKNYINSQGHGTTPWTELEDTELYAHWSNGSITLPTASRPGYAFDGWYTSSEGGIKRENDYQYEETTNLYAHWSPLTYRIDLDYNTNDGGSTVENEHIEYFNQVFDKNFENLFYPTRNGYDFLGWYTEDDKLITRETRATNEYKIIDKNGITLKAKWQKKQYDLHLDLNKQLDMTYNPMIESEVDLKMTFDSSDNNTVGVPYVKGWTFLGWYIGNTKVFNDDGTHNTDINTYFDSRNNWIYLDNLSLVAKWEQNTYTLTIDINPNDKMSYEPVLSNGSSAYSYTMTFDSTNNNHLPTGVLEGWTFLGWYDSDNNLVYDSDGVFIESTATDYFKSGKWVREGDLLLHAEWDQKPISVVLDKNDADLYDKPTLERDAYIFTYDDPILENINVPSFLSGYEFLGWYDGDTLVFNVDGSINESATAYFNGNKWIKSTNVLLKAKWKANGYIVTLHQPEATKIGTETIFINYNAPLPNIVVPERKYSVTYHVNDSEGSTRSTEVSNIVKEWTFDGYFTSTNNEYYNSSGETTIVYHEAQNIDLYAHWSNGTLENMPQPTRVGYIFDGWYTDTTYTTKIENGYSVEADIELYAHWIPKTYTITLDNNKASIEGTTSLEVSFDQEVDDIVVPTKIYTITLDKNYDVENRLETKEANWTFKGYYSQPNGLGSRYYDAEGHINQVYTLDDNLTLYAYYEGGTITLPEYTREDYIFKGWYDLETNTKAEETDTYEENKTLSIKWNSEEYNLTLLANKPANMTSTITLLNDEYKMAMHTPINNIINTPIDTIGWTFLGWYDEDTLVFDENGHYQTSASSFFDSEGNWIKKENVTLKAHWVENAYPLILKPGELDPLPNIPVNTYTLIFDNPALTSVSIPDYYSGYTFDGYYLEDEMIFDSSGYRVNDNSVFTATGNVKAAKEVELTAHWTAGSNLLQLVVVMPDMMTDIPRLTTSTYQMVKDSPDNNLVNVPSKVTGFDFLGWYDGDEKVFDSTGMHVTSSYFDEDGNWLKEDGVRLISKYDGEQFIISLKEDENTIVPTNTYTVLYSSVEPANIAIPEENELFEFTGWYYDSTMVFDAEGNKNLEATAFFDSEGKWLYLGNVELTAHWERKPIKVSLDLNPDPYMVDEPTVNKLVYEMTLNSTNNNVINIPNPVTYYIFQGWYDGDTQVYKADGTYNASASSFFNSNGEWIRETPVTLKAVWREVENRYNTITLDVNKSKLMNQTPELAEDTYELKVNDTINNTVNVPSNPEGFVFDGWYHNDTKIYDKDGTYVSDTGYFDSEGKWIKRADITLKAKWQRTIVEELVNNSNAIVNKYYNKYTNGYKIIPKEYVNASQFDSAIYYIPIGEYNGTTPSTISINGNTYNNSGSGYTLDIGMDAVIIAPVYKVESGILYVATPWLITSSEKEVNINISLGDSTYNVIAYNNDIYNNNLRIKSSTPLYTRDGYINRVEYDSSTNTYNHITNHGNHALGVTLESSSDGLNYTEVLNATDILYRLNENGSVELKIPKDGVSYVLYPFEFEDEIFTDINKETSGQFKISKIGYGSVEFKYYSTVPKSTVTFNTDGGNSIESVTLVTGNTITLPTPEKQYYIFDKWVLNNDESVEFTNDTPVNDDITLKAIYVHGPYYINLDLTKPDDMESNIQVDNTSYEVNIGSTDNNNINVPNEITGWTFNGWYDDNNNLVFKQDGSYNDELDIYFDSEGKWKYTDKDVITLKSEWTQEQRILALSEDITEGPTTMELSTNMYTMLYDNNGITSVAVPTTEDFYMFTGWYDSDNNMIFDENGNLVTTNNPYFDSNGKWKYLDNLLLHSEWTEMSNVLKLMDMSPTQEEQTTIFKNYKMEKNSTVNNVVDIPEAPEGWMFYGWMGDNGELVYDYTGRYYKTYENIFSIFEIESLKEEYLKRLRSTHPDAEIDPSDIEELGELPDESTYFDSEGKWLKDDGGLLYAVYMPKGLFLTIVITDPTDSSNETILDQWTDFEVYGNNYSDKQYGIPLASEPAYSDYIFKGYYYGDIKVIDETGKLNTSLNDYFDYEGNLIYAGKATIISRWEKKTPTVEDGTEFLLFTDLNIPEELADYDKPTLAQETFAMQYNKTTNNEINYPTESIGMYYFTGWYDSDNVQVFDEHGKFVPGTKYWDSEGKWIYADDLFVNAHWTQYNG